MSKSHNIAPLGFEDSIRLFALGRKSSRDVNVTLREYRLSTAPAYIALSYEWGPQGVTREIHLNGRPIPVRRNLYEALRAILARRTSWLSLLSKLKRATGPSYELLSRLDESKEILLWVDALCIDQSSTQERTHQVGIMGRIYSKAFGVVAWLGLPDQSVPRAMELIKARFLRNVGGSPSGGGTVTVVPSDTEFEGLNSLFSRPYWTRLWIMQEIVLASKIVYLCGPHAMVQDQLGPVFETYQANKPTQKLTGLETLRMAKSWSPSRKDLHVAVAQMSHMACGDPRDAVFALLAITRTALDQKGRYLVADYSKSTEEVFRDLILGLMTERSSATNNCAADLVGQMVCQSPKRCQHGNGPLLVHGSRPIVREVVSGVLYEYESMRLRYPFEAVPSRDIGQYLRGVAGEEEPQRQVVGASSPTIPLEYPHPPPSER